MNVAYLTTEHVEARLQRVAAHAGLRQHGQFLSGGPQFGLVLLNLLLLVLVVMLDGLQCAVDQCQLFLRTLQLDVLLQPERPPAGLNGPRVYLAQRVDGDECAVVLLLLVSVVFLWYYARQKHLISEKNHALVRMIREQSAARENAQPNVPDPDLFRTVDRTIREERLYTSASLQRQDVLDRFGISRRTLSDLLAAYAGGQSFTVYINTMRLQDALNLLQDNPEMSLTDIAEKVGFSPATFRDQFKRQFGMTPTEYRQNL